jgi:hypothetical protein
MTTKQITCEFCRAFNGRSRCGCAQARAARGEKSAPVVDINSIVLFDQNGKKL